MPFWGLGSVSKVRQSIIQFDITDMMQNNILIPHPSPFSAKGDKEFIALNNYRLSINNNY